MFQDAFRRHRCLVVAGRLLRVAEGRRTKTPGNDSPECMRQIWSSSS